MKKNKAEILNSIYSFVFFLFITFLCYNCYIYLNCYSTTRTLLIQEEPEYIRFMIYGSSSTAEGNTVSGTISIIDSNGNEIAVIERSWSGSYLSIEFGECNFNNKTFFFPNKIYGKERITETIIDRKKGTSLEKYYNENRQCMLLGYGSTLKERQQLYTIARFATNKIPVVNFGKKNKYYLDLSACKTETYYSIKKDKYGNLVIEEL